MMRHIKGEGGLVSHLGTSSLIEVEQRIADGDAYARAVLEAMAYQIAKEIGALATVVSGQLDSVILTGGCAYSRMLTDLVRDRVAFLAPVTVVPAPRKWRRWPRACSAYSAAKSPRTDTKAQRSKPHVSEISGHCRRGTAAQPQAGDRHCCGGR